MDEPLGSRDELLYRAVGRRGDLAAGGLRLRHGGQLHGDRAVQRIDYLLLPSPRLRLHRGLLGLHGRRVGGDGGVPEPADAKFGHAAIGHGHRPVLDRRGGRAGVPGRAAGRRDVDGRRDRGRGRHDVHRRRPGRGHHLHLPRGGHQRGGRLGSQRLADRRHPTERPPRGHGHVRQRQPDECAMDGSLGRRIRLCRGAVGRRADRLEASGLTRRERDEFHGPGPVRSRDNLLFPRSGLQRFRLQLVLLLRRRDHAVVAARPYRCDGRAHVGHGDHHHMDRRGGRGWLCDRVQPQRVERLGAGRDRCGKSDKLQRHRADRRGVALLPGAVDDDRLRRRIERQ